jgi:hypothetical protein
VKRLLIYGGVGLLLLVGGAMFAIDSIAASAIESGVEAGLGAPTEVGSVRLRLLMGSFRMSDLEIANPPGFESAHFLRLGHAETELSYGALREGDVVLAKLVLADLDLQLEWKGRESNYDAILEGTGGEEGGEDASAEEAPEEPSETRFIIDELLIQNVTATLRIDSVGDAEIEIPEIRLEAIGRKSGGVAMRDLAQRVTRAVVAEAMKKGKGLGPAFSVKAGAGLNEALSLREGSTSDRLDKAGELFRGLLKRDDD